MPVSTNREGSRRYHQCVSTNDTQAQDTIAYDHINIFVTAGPDEAMKDVTSEDSGARKDHSVYVDAVE